MKQKTDSCSLTSSLDEGFSTFKPFANIEAVLSDLKTAEFLACSGRRRFKKILESLYQLIQETPEPAFVLDAVLHFLEQVNQAKVLQDSLSLAHFELWLNQFSGLSAEENRKVRAKIAGKWLPREAFQLFFPVGMNKSYLGSHFIAAHLSPDIDTMTASFWGWLDAFTVRLGTALHFWSLPGGPPDSPFVVLFEKLIGPGLFKAIARVSQQLSLTAMDLMIQQGMKKMTGDALTTEIDTEVNHGADPFAIVLVDESGHYIGDWRSADVEAVRQVTTLFKSGLRWFENNFHTQLISLFAKADLSLADLPHFYSSLFDVKIRNSGPALEFSEGQKKELDNLLKKILLVKDGLDGTFHDLHVALSLQAVVEVALFQKEIADLGKQEIFDSNGKLKEDRSLIFHHLQKVIQRLDQAMHQARNYVEKLDVAILIKHQVLEHPFVYLHLRSDVDEIRQKMCRHSYLTVVIQEKDGALFPIGIVRAEDLARRSLGTVSFRDFSNHEEVRMAPYLEVISVIDHHKSSLKTGTIPSIFIGDAQSCNVLIAEKSFAINRLYSTAGFSKESIDSQIAEVSKTLDTPSSMRILQKLLQKKMALMLKHGFYVHPAREFKEYLSFLYAILDDTDLLTKVTARDVVCIVELLNRLKSLVMGKEVELLHLDDIPRDHHFANVAARRILQQKEMYMLYQKIYAVREEEVAAQLTASVLGHKSSLFLDTKEQNGCARVGQVKLFSSNFAYFLKHADTIRASWIAEAKQAVQASLEIDLHIQMISTIASAEEVYKNGTTYTHSDEIWLWIPEESQLAYDHLNSFLSSFTGAIKERKEIVVELRGQEKSGWSQLFHEYFGAQVAEVFKPEEREQIAILRFPAGKFNSRKTAISAHLPMN